MPQMTPYQGTFSFVTSILHRNVKSQLPDYDQKDPKTWPYVTLAAIEQQHPYWGYPDLPAGIAYERSVMQRYETMYSAEERRQSAALNSSFHQRYPCNYDQHDQLKDQVGMSAAEYKRYMATIAKGIPTATYDYLQRCQRRGPITKRNTALDHECGTNRRCLRAGHGARMQGGLLDRESQLLRPQQQHVGVLQGHRDMTSRVEAELERQRQRAVAAEVERELYWKKNLRLSRRVRELERRANRADRLERYCNDLK